MRITTLLISSLILSGCATGNQGLYQWANYDRNLYNYYAKPETAEEFRVQLEAHLNALEQKKAPVAPGLYAELGTLYFQKGDRDSALRWYDKERTAWPESRFLMDAITTALAKREAEGNK